MHLFVTHTDGAIVELLLAGELDFQLTADLEAVAASSDPTMCMLVVDMHCVDFIDGAILRCLERIAGYARAGGAEVVIAGATRTVRRAFEICESPLQTLLAP